ncbi:la-related protein 7 [Palaemon carinicauda]|uniref:la-related protein 7 n=1 Tax=Palaemon carinicauda TaxID=392227 RepID=UPI0035B69A4D
MNIYSLLLKLYFLLVYILIFPLWQHCTRSYCSLLESTAIANKFPEVECVPDRNEPARPIGQRRSPSCSFYRRRNAETTISVRVRESKLAGAGLTRPTLEMEKPQSRIDGKKQSDFEMEDAEEDTKKGARHRKKHLINKLRVQMEFYFSAANLSKDKFMSGLLEESPYIDLDIFFRFNRIRSFTDDINLLKRAIEKSPILELSDDGSKVKRSVPVKKKENETLCTIYVENIPSHVDHEWVHEVFAKYGTIDYISFPRFKNTGRPKGFAFVEFETPERANIALKCFGAAGCKIPIDTEPSKLRSICTHEKAGGDDVNQIELSVRPSFGEVQQSENGDQSDPQLKEDIGNREVECENSDEKNASGKRKRDETEENKDENEGISCKKSIPKKPKTESSESCDTECSLVGNVSNDENLPGSSEAKVEKVEEAVENTDDGGKKVKISEIENTDDDGKKVKISEIENVIQEVRRSVDAVKETGENSLSSQVKRPLDSDENCRKLKKQKVGAESNLPPLIDSGKDKSMSGEESVASKTKAKKKKRKRSRKDKGDCLGGISLKVMSKQEWTRLRNEYLNMQKRYMETLKWDLQKRKYVPADEYRPERVQSKGMPKFIPDAVIKISFEEPPQDPKKLHDAIREGGGGGVAYVETSAVEKDVYVRFISSEAAAAYLKAGLWSRMILLSGEEEKMYWNHCIDSWMMRRGKNRRKKGTINDMPNEPRGREKLLQRALREARNDKPVCHKVFEA